MVLGTDFLRGIDVALMDCTKELWHQFYKNYASDPMMDDFAYTYSFDDVERAYGLKTSDNTRLYFFIVNKGRVIGQIYLKRIDRAKKTTEFGIALINDSVKGKGYGTEAIRLLANYAFNTLGFYKISASTVLRNTRSQHILKKLGFKCVGEDYKFKYYTLVRHNI